MYDPHYDEKYRQYMKSNAHKQALCVAILVLCGIGLILGICGVF